MTKLDKVFKAFGEKPDTKKCPAIIGLLKEGEEIASSFRGSPAIDAALISSAQKVEHYEIASYGCLHEWAKVLENEEAAGLLESILEEEKAANELLIKLARSISNNEAVANGADRKSSIGDKSGNKKDGNRATPIAV